MWLVAADAMSSRRDTISARIALQNNIFVASLTGTTIARHAQRCL